MYPITPLLSEGTFPPFIIHTVYSRCHNKPPPLGPGGGDGQALSNKVGGGMEELVPVVWARGGMGMRCPVVLDVKPWFGTFISEFI